MGTHPIFESDFDCLTDWKETRKKGTLVPKILILNQVGYVDFVRDAKLGKSLRDWSTGASRIGQKDTKKFKGNLVNRFSRKKRTRTQAYKDLDRIVTILYGTDGNDP